MPFGMALLFSLGLAPGLRGVKGSRWSPGVYEHRTVWAIFVRYGPILLHNHHPQVPTKKSWHPAFGGPSTAPGWGSRYPPKWIKELLGYPDFIFGSVVFWSYACLHKTQDTRHKSFLDLFLSTRPGQVICLCLVGDLCSVEFRQNFCTIVRPTMRVWFFFGVPVCGFVPCFQLAWLTLREWNVSPPWCGPFWYFLPARSGGVGHGRMVVGWGSGVERFFCFFRQKFCREPPYTLTHDWGFWVFGCLCVVLFHVSQLPLCRVSRHTDVRSRVRVPSRFFLSRRRLVFLHSTLQSIHTHQYWSQGFGICDNVCLCVRHFRLHGAVS